MRERLVYPTYAAGWRLVRALPAPVAAGLFATAADLLYLRRDRNRGLGRLAANLRRVVGPDLPDAEFDRLVHRAVRSYARYWLELFRLPSLSREHILATFHLAEEEVLAAEATSGRGVVLALPHSANWDLAGAWVAATAGLAPIRWIRKTRTRLTTRISPATRRCATGKARLKKGVMAGAYSVNRPAYDPRPRKNCATRRPQSMVAGRTSRISLEWSRQIRTASRQVRT